MWGSPGIRYIPVHVESAGILRQLGRGMRGRLSLKKSLVFWLKSSLEENKKSGCREGSLSQKQVRCEGEQHCVWERHKHLFVQSSVVGKPEDPDTIPGSQRKEGLLPAVIVSFSN